METVSRPPRRFALLLEYQGTAYGGSQYQKNAPTVQGTLERALGKLTSESSRVAMAGRTDAGVHALGQVASFTTRSRHSPDVMARALNALLPVDIAVRAAALVPPDFDPRRHAISRWYQYRLHLASQRPALLRHYVWHLGRSLNVAAMNEAAACLVGTHDFAAFTAPSEARRAVTVRDLHSAAVSRRGDLLIVDVVANAFLPHMVRRIVGTLADVGLGKVSYREFARLVADAPPGAATKTAPPRGLCLMKVRYESGLFDEQTDENIQP